ncbi:exported hypothetical protein [Candidatus Zixiibacteriota bacterium]|nr:exported hypothetical protein [candidate division Zixibacteria bacterium]
MYKFVRMQYLVLAVLLVAAVAGAQNQPASVLNDSRMVVIPVRGLSEIASDIDNAMAYKQHAMDRKSQADNRLTEIDGALETRKAANKDIDRRKSEAKEAKRESEAIALDIEKKVNQQAMELLNRLKDLRKAEIEEAKLATDMADAEIKALQLENELQDKRIEYDSLVAAAASTLTQTTSQQVLRELEKKLLKQQEEHAGAMQKLASKQKDIISRRMKLHEAQAKLMMPRA